MVHLVNLLVIGVVSLTSVQGEQGVQFVYIKYHFLAEQVHKGLTDPKQSRYMAQIPTI